MSVSASKFGPAGLDLSHSVKFRPSRRPPTDDGSFREAMASMASTVAVVTAELGGERIGRTVTSAMSLSARPPSIVISIDFGSRLADFIGLAEGFSYAVLADGQDRIADAFAGGVAPQERFRLGRWDRWASGHPRLAGAVSVLDCETIGSISTATHVLVIGAVVEADTVPGRSPLLWHERRFRRLGEERSPSRREA